MQLAFSAWYSAFEVPVQLVLFLSTDSVQSVPGLRPVSSSASWVEAAVHEAASLR